MTDLLETPGEVTTTRLDELRAAFIPPDDFIRENVRRFGFEYEMFNSDHRHDGHAPNASGLTPADMTALRRFEADFEWDDFEWECDDDCEYDDYGNYCSCQTRAFNSGPRQSFIASLHPTPVGERANLSTVQRLAHQFFDAGLIVAVRQHGYHCQCDDCAHTRSGPLMTFQADCSCGCEFVSRIIDLDDFTTARTDIAALVGVMERWRDNGGWMPDGRTANGNHVHVSAEGNRIPWAENVRNQAYRHINALYAAFDWTTIADGGCGNIRGYNQKPNKVGNAWNGSWLSDRGYGTFEHRVWNTPAEPTRLWVSIGLSIALTRWAFGVAANNPDFHIWFSGEPDRYGDRRYSLDDPTYNALCDLLPTIRGQIAAYVPNGPEFDEARTIIHQLAPA